MNLEKILKVAVRGGASDIILKPGVMPRFRFQGEILNLADGEVITPQMMMAWIGTLVPPHMKHRLQQLEDLDFAYASPLGNRFRVNLFRQKQSYAMILRVINNHIRTMEELQLPQVMHTFAEERRGLVLVTGATGSGKSTTLASIIEKINASRASHILTIEDPIEFVFTEKRSTINQREIGVDAESFAAALRSALRQNPDVILVGELRDKETTETALMAAETGHLVLSTLHTMDATESITRLLSYFPPHQHPSLKIMLSQTLKAIVSQRLVPRKDNKGMVPAIEILIANELVRENIQKGEDFSLLKDAIRNSRNTYGMQSFDHSLLTLYKSGIITQAEALEHASNRKDLELAMQGFES
ncbi:type IV pilus twitching motility protein PilT [Oligoflexus tunisiensis]|uniref:type IV pilus twitching motility protein PilT n=1 Tax=Oligoflexus tunisiensis TaxID=708132 RepID=UPI000B040BF4|nr:PilT/PilU family type 4a pilus ATPase [Oligoflexus tunisiensis]